ncbi:ribosome maturation factor RimP [Tissierella creatinophila]|uniref:Ribosome maturation factor RimP n=1 Tax=Tissierella creatinophila DSM 6911 TaxID=1123403 RepID=A0A1U7M3G4_TISCR|nr:ribosome maturation factor RimP [Tissierella creatinophila]OLS01759.1 ribosome maturation factor RimP [Tissierella creatinophila DSM 6911]
MLNIVGKISNDIAEKLGYELVDIEYVKEFGNYFLKIYVDKVGGITLDDCQKVSEELSTKLDEKDPIPEEYYLEVSSPGLDRPLKTDKDLKRNLERDVELKLYKPFENKKMYEGELKNYSKDKITLKQNGNLVDIPREYISIIKLSIKF